MSKFEIVAFIFARGGSKGLKNKNLRQLMGKPLIAWSIEQAKSIPIIKRVIVSTDSKSIADVAKKFGAEVPFMRPKEISKDNSPEWLAWRHALNYLKKNEGKLPDIMLSVPTTSPLRRKEDLIKSINIFKKGGADVVITISEAKRNPWFNMVKETKNGKFELVNKINKAIFRRQDAKKVYDMTTIAYVLSPKFVLKKKSLFSGRVKALKIPVERSIDIDTLYDFEIVELLMAGKNKK
jgi:CMP-N-acetylneuraminic acid synthetase